MKEIEFKGKCFKSLRELCLTLNIPYCRVQARLKKGIDLNIALSDKRLSNRTWKDHLGNIYPTLKAMCQTYNIGTLAFNSRLDRGWDLKKTLTKKGNGIEVIYHGVKYKSILALAKILNMYQGTLQKRIDRKVPEELWDYKGTIIKPICVCRKWYASIKDAAIALGLNPKRATESYCRGISLEEQLNRKRKKKK